MLESVKKVAYSHFFARRSALLVKGRFLHKLQLHLYGLSSGLGNMCGKTDEPENFRSLLLFPSGSPKTKREKAIIRTKCRHFARAEGLASSGEGAVSKAGRGSDFPDILFSPSVKNQRLLQPSSSEKGRYKFPQDA